MLDGQLQIWQLINIIMLAQLTMIDYIPYNCLFNSCVELINALFCAVSMTISIQSNNINNKD